METLHCTCSNPGCPFQQQTTHLYEICTSTKEDRDNYILKRQSAPAALALHKTGSGSPPLLNSSPVGLRHTGIASCNMRGVQRRADGTIIECDGPGRMCGTERRNLKNGIHSRFNSSHLNVTSLDPWSNCDCEVDQENSFNNDDYEFSRQAPERRIVRISPRLHVKKYKNISITRKASLPATPSFQHHQENQRSMSMPSSYSRGMSKSRQISESVPSLVAGIHKMFNGPGTIYEMNRERLAASAY